MSNRIEPIHQSLYPSLGSLSSALEYLGSQLPIHQPNQLKTVLMTYQNTLLKELEKEDGLTVDQLAQRRYPGVTYDTALPHTWVTKMQERGFDPRGHFITLYPRDSGPFGYMAPITDEGVRIAALVASSL